MNEKREIYETSLSVDTVKVFGRVPSAIFLILKQSNHFGEKFDDWLTLCIVTQLKKEGLIEKSRKRKSNGEGE